MSELNQAQQPEPLLGAGGFEDETGKDNPTDAPANMPKAKKGKSSAELKANFMAVFGHGIGKFALIAAAIVVIVLAAVGLRGFNSKPALDKQDAQIDVPTAPPSRVSVDPIDEREANRRAHQGVLEANIAAKSGQTYQPDFNPAVIANQPPSGQTGNSQPQLTVGESQATRTGQPPVPPGTQPNPVPISVNAGQSSAKNQVGQGNNQQGSAQQQEEQRRQQAEHDKQVTARDKYVADVHKSVLEQTEEWLGKAKQGDIRGSSAYSVVSYLPSTQTTGSTAPSSSPAPTPSIEPVVAKKSAIFKAGKTIFATLDSEVNTDDGGEVFATVHGGKYDGAKLIGKIEQAPRNIRLRFSVLAPNDDRSTLNINAVAIREQDAKQGVAETIDNHTLERYTALFAGSILSGISKAAMQPEGESIVLPNGQVIVSQPRIDGRRIGLYALGEVGINAASEVRKTFSTPATYSTPANKGIGVIFLTDVNEK